MNADEIHNQMQKLASEETAQILRSFFKTGPGEYGEGDLFLGIRVPELRKLSKTYQAIALPEITKLLRSAYHEERLLALLILIRAYNRADARLKDKIYELYLSNTKFINNWDLVDASAEHIVGAYLKDKNREPLHALAQSKAIWERRIAIMATFHYIKAGEFSQTLLITQTLLNDKEDLIHKATGWMLREVGKRNLEIEEAFLRKHYKEMARTMLRYAIEKFPQERRLLYLKGMIEEA